MDLFIRMKPTESSCMVNIKHTITSKQKNQITQIFETVTRVKISPCSTKCTYIMGS